MLVFEARRPDDAARQRRRAGRVAPGAGARPTRCGATSRRWSAEHRLDFLREPDPGFAWAAWRWAEGDDLDDVLEGTELAAGDFVRWVKQLVDLAGQVADAAGEAAAARRPPATSCARCAVAWWPTPRSATDASGLVALSEE